MKIKTFSYNFLKALIESQDGSIKPEHKATSQGFLSRLHDFKIFFLIHMIHRVFRVADTLNQTLQAKSKTINEILTQATVCILNLERKKSTYQNFFNKIVDRAQSLGINAPEKMLLDENERAAKKVVLAVSAQSKRKKIWKKSIFDYFFTKFWTLFLS